ncbi:ABC transporter ATP-binding protein [Roseitranquillus sediminis]|uniref:ABC transporter ATP-binding protein n=1 Tax=Roseitranquillus sediminis TaxID=2809051 RepID=UPI001D0C84BF|nr:oligopeptide/dipeptide ABC transporter ATP-binding protein [Roseitranquillus sediminis]MBM9595454.1 ATP-binding cassette domain-containing protein [Roseitranquillus sediminis]
MSAPQVIRAEGLSKSFVVGRDLLGRPTRRVRAVDDVSLSVGARETLALVGESGCGKSTLGRMVMCLIPPDHGTVEMHGQPVSHRSERDLRQVRRKAQLVFQDPYSALNPRMTAGQLIGEPLMLHDLVPRADRAARVAELMEAVGLAAPQADRYPHEFSGGQRQRIVIARALAAEPEIIVCDEPVSALDVSVQSQILNLLVDLQERLGLSYLFISHDLGVVQQMADRVAVMYLGRIVEIGTAAEVLDAPRHPYTRALVASAPVARPGKRRGSPPVEGDLPSPVAPPPGCHFHTRCPFAEDICRREVPALISGEAGGAAAACHFRDSLPPAEPPRPAATPSPALARLMTAFHAGSVP